MTILEKSCTLCGSQPEEGMHLTGIKLIKKKEKPYALCKQCCFNRELDPDAKIAFRKKLWDRIEKKLAAKPAELEIC